MSNFFPARKVISSVELAYRYVKFSENIRLPKLVVLHGMLGSKTNFASIIKNRKISSNISSAYLLDLRNHGETQHTDTMTNEELALDIKYFLLKHELENVCLLGHSFGGRVIFSYLSHYLSDAQKRLSGVAIIDIHPGGLKFTNKDIYIRLSKMNLKDRNYLDIKRELDIYTMNQDMTNLLISNLVCEDKIIDQRKNQNFAWMVNLKAIVDYLEMYTNFEFNCNWRGKQIVICGENSKYVTKNEINYFLNVFPALNPQTDIKFISNAGHWVHYENPQAFLNEVGGFLSNLK